MYPKPDPMTEKQRDALHRLIHPAEWKEIPYSMTKDQASRRIEQAIYEKERDLREYRQRANPAPLYPIRRVTPPTSKPKPPISSTAPPLSAAAIVPTLPTAEVEMAVQPDASRLGADHKDALQPQAVAPAVSEPADSIPTSSRTESSEFEPTRPWGMKKAGVFEPATSRQKNFLSEILMPEECCRIPFMSKQQAWRIIFRYKNADVTSPFYGLLPSEWRDIGT